MLTTLKFVCSDDQQKRFAVAVRKNVNDYFRLEGISTKGNLAMVLQTIAMLSLYIIPFLLVVTIPMDGWVALVMAVISGIGMAGIAISVMQDAVQGSYSKKEGVNKMLGGTI